MASTRDDVEQLVILVLYTESCHVDFVVASVPVAVVNRRLTDVLVETGVQCSCECADDLASTVDG